MSTFGIHGQQRKAERVVIEVLSQESPCVLSRYCQVRTCDTIGCVRRRSCFVSLILACSLCSFVDVCGTIWLRTLGPECCAAFAKSKSISMSIFASLCTLFVCLVACIRTRTLVAELGCIRFCFCEASSPRFLPLHRRMNTSLLLRQDSVLHQRNLTWWLSFVFWRKRSGRSPALSRGRRTLETARGFSLLSGSERLIGTHTHTTVWKYRGWCKAHTVRELNNLDDRGLALIVFSLVSGRAKAMWSVLERCDAASTGLERIWNWLDDVFEKLPCARLDDVLQPVANWCSTCSAVTSRCARRIKLSSVMLSRPRCFQVLGLRDMFGRKEQHSEYDTHPIVDQEEHNVAGPQVYLEDGDDQTDDLGTTKTLPRPTNSASLAGGRNRRLRVSLTTEALLQPGANLQLCLESVVAMRS